ncbi:ADP-ribosylation factor GTPase-activating protein 2 [Dimargaris xerosporica]|nr:ADP-ribosylation factor GTPase-activating protein 2 [Dimargaris xerosporica]
MANFFQQHGGMGKYKDALAKYTSRAAVQYKEKLNRLAQLDAQQYPNKVILGNVQASTATTATEVDFFEAFESPQLASAGESAPLGPADREPGLIDVVEKPLTTVSPALASPGSVKSPSSTTSAQSIPSRTTARSISSSLRAKSGSAGSLGKKGLGGAKKFGTRAKPGFSFDEAQKMAEASAQEAVPTSPLRPSALAEPVVPTTEPLDTSSSALSSRLAYQASPSASKDPLKPATGSHDVDRLGMGFGRMGFGAVQTTNKVTAGTRSGANDDASDDNGDAPRHARERFGGAKAISSAQFFGRDEQTDSANQARINQFSGASSISSAQYFGRDEESENAYRPGESGGLDFSQLGNSANEVAQRLLSQTGTDVDGLKMAIRSGSAKLSDYLRDLQDRYA